MSKQALAVKYRPKKFEDVVEQTVPKAILTEQLKNKTFKNCLLFCGGAGTGKAQPLYSKVLTPNGFITMGDVEVGTEVITDKGNIAKVSGVYPQGIRPIYRITLQDRTYIDVSDEHLNVVYRYNQHKKVREDFVLTTKELLTLFQDSSEKLRIDVPKALDFGNNKDLPIDPYLLGALIGDGSLSPGNFAFSNMEEDVLNKVDSILDKYGCELVPLKDSMCDYRIRLKNKPVYYKFKYKDTVFDSVASLSKHLNDEGYPLFDSGTIIRLSGNNAKNTLAHYPELFGAVQLIESVDYSENCCNKLKQCLKEYGLDCKSVEKHIPQEYLLSSKENRLQLLRGLFDTDGYVDGCGNTTLTTSSPQLSEDIAFLVRSLGCRDTVTCSSSGYVSNDGSYISCSNSYSHNIKVPKQLIICSSEKHLNRYRTRMYEPMRNIIDIEYIGNMECQCIMVDHEDHTYISDGFIPTHNTTSARIFANEINDFKGHPIEIDAASHNGVEDARKIIEDARTQSLDSEYKTFVLDECFHKDTLITTPSGTIKISELTPGSIIYNITGETTVKNIFKNSVPPERLALVTMEDNQLLTTVDHLFLTKNGWKESKNLQKGDVLVDYKDLCSMWQNVPMLSKRQADDLFRELWKNLSKTTDSKEFISEGTQDVDESVSCMSKNFSDISFGQFNYLWKRLLHYIQEATRVNRKTKEFICSIICNIPMSSLWENFTRTNMQESKVLFQQMCHNVSETTCGTETDTNIGSCLCYMWQYIFKECTQQSSDLFSRMYFPISFATILSALFGDQTTANVNEQPITQSGEYSEDVTDKGEERNTSRVEWDTWWKWALYSTSNDTVSESCRKLGVRVSCTNEEASKFGVSYELQTRPCLTTFETGYRGRWQDPFVEILTTSGCQENAVIKSVRVDSVTVYQRGNNEQLFSNYFTDNELHADFVDMYDIEVYGHPSYFVNNVLVHNCHMLSNSAWNALLKVIEEPPKKTVFLFCTTDPQKIPATILSRVQRYNFQKISQSGIIGRLKYIIGEENKEISAENPDNIITYEDSAIEFIAKLADGGMRDSITLLDKALGYSNKLTLDNVLEALGSVNYDTMFELTDALNKMNATKALETIGDVYKSGLDLKQFIKQYSYFVLDLCKYKYLKNFDNLQMPAIYEDKLKTYGAEDFDFFCQLLDTILELSKALKDETVPKPLVESKLLLLCMEA